MRGFARRLRSNFGIRSARMSIRSQMAWQWRWLLNVLVMVLVATVVWWLVENSYRITGLNRDEVRQRMGALVEENRILKRAHREPAAFLPGEISGERPRHNSAGCGDHFFFADRVEWLDVALDDHSKSSMFRNTNRKFGEQA